MPQVRTKTHVAPQVINNLDKKKTVADDKDEAALSKSIQKVASLARELYLPCSQQLRKLLEANNHERKAPMCNMIMLCPSPCTRRSDRKRKAAMKTTSGRTHLTVRSIDSAGTVDCFANPLTCGCVQALLLHGGCGCGSFFTGLCHQHGCPPAWHFASQERGDFRERRLEICPAKLAHAQSPGP